MNLPGRAATKIEGVLRQGPGGGVFVKARWLVTYALLLLRIESASSRAEPSERES